MFSRDTNWFPLYVNIGYPIMCIAVILFAGPHPAQKCDQNNNKLKSDLIMFILKSIFLTSVGALWKLRVQLQTHVVPEQK